MGSPGKGGGGKVGGGKVLAGKSGGGKGGGKGGGGGGGSSTQAVFCFSQQVLDEITAAFNSATQSTGLSDGCVAGLMMVTLEPWTTHCRSSSWPPSPWD